MAESSGCAVWTIVAADPVVGATLHGVDGVATDDVWAVGDNGGLYPILEHWDGTAWAATTQEGMGNSLHAIAALSSSDAWAVGNRTDHGLPATLVEHYDGVRWSQVAAPSPRTDDHLYGIASVSSSDVWAGGSFNAPDGSIQPLFLHYDGLKWRWVKGPVLGDGGIILSMSATTPTDVWAVGYQDSGIGAAPQPLIEHWNGAAWREIASARVPTDLGSNLLTVSSIAGDDAWSLGFAGQPIGLLSEHYDGTRWRLVRSPHFGAMNGSFAIASEDVWAVGEYADPEVVASSQHWDGTRWDLMVTPQPGTQSALEAVTALATNDIWAVGNYITQDQSFVPLVMHSSGVCP